ncbi:MAG TPA: phosphoribosyltransferase family protein [Oscillospiraceae bacterium]|nr:phosphoribosyltransferase family protein [Oscillospiraceae bacterium]HPF56922.1 phosphoribosyltransferase family protein [Clostridiales bacterium]HPK36326.1 phosphoribosyltransferase family protein [Oscillospiraceae bacterium]HPR76099.1 phosphoribosyltransferase family protein [Oscillospiraceae bacterium]
MPDYYEMTIAGLKRHLPICPINDKLDIAAFILLGDVELTVACAEALLKKAPEFDIILTPEAKSITLAYEMAKMSGKPYLVARKSAKLYMKDPIFVEVKSITTENVQKLYIDSKEAARMKNKRVLVVDDVISTGKSLEAVDTLVQKSGGKICGQMAVLAEGEAAERKDILFLEPLPLFFK